MVGGRGSVGLEKRAAREQRCKVTLPAGDFAELLQVVLEARIFCIDHSVGAKRGQHAALPSGGLDGLVKFQRVDRGVRSGEDLELEAVEEGAREELGCFELGGNNVDPAWGFLLL